MSEFTNKKAVRVKKLIEVSKLLLETGNARPFIIENEDFIQTVVPEDFITLFDELIKEGLKVDDLKPLTNKVLNIFHQAIENYPIIEPKPDSFLAVLESNNQKMVDVLNEIRPLFKKFIQETKDEAITKQLLTAFKKLEVFAKHYTIKENILFPAIERAWPDYRCLQIMWSFHDDIRRNIKYVITQLNEGVTDFKLFNKSVGDVFFNMMAIKFREERILFPLILSTIKERDLNRMNREAVEMGYPYIQPTSVDTEQTEQTSIDGLANLGTGSLSIEQIKLIFNHLPVDITYVDENDKVCYFSTPKKRIFPRTIAIIGREVSNCHPPESVHVVEKIVDSFKNGEKSQADFWIKMKGEYILIQYFAVRDEKGAYKGVIEVSQEVTHIKALEGEKRLLDW